MINKTLATILLTITIFTIALPMAFSSPIDEMAKEQQEIIANLSDESLGGANTGNETINSPCIECLKTVIAGYEFMSQKGPKIVAQFLATCSKLGPNTKKECIEFTANNVEKFVTNGQEVTKNPIKLCKELCPVA